MTSVSTNKNLQVLISTMNQTSWLSLITSMNLKNDVIIINQVTSTKPLPKKTTSKKSVKFLSYKEKGLSKSRNRAIENSNADICIIADDDMHYVDNLPQIIHEGYEKYPDADIIAFFVDSEDKTQTKKPLPEGPVDLLHSMKLSSVQLTFKRKTIIDRGLKFRENFGAGAEFYMGEENIFLADCLRAGLKVYSLPIKIATLKESESTWFNGYTPRYFKVKGLVFFHISKYLYPMLIIQFALRKYGIYFAGDFVSNTGPANVNKRYKQLLNDGIYASQSNNKIVRTLHFISKVLFADTILVSGLSKFHLDILRVSQMLGKNVSYLMHGYTVVEDKLNSTEYGDKISKLERNILNESDKIICVSENFANYLKNAEPDLRDKITFVNNGVDLPATDPVSKRKNEKRFIILSVGGGMPRKNNLIVCKAIAKLNDSRITFVVIGDSGIDGNKIKKYSFVEYHEKLNHDKVLEMMSNADLYIQNSTFETFGLAVCEALSRGCNLLASKDVGAISVLDNLKKHNLINDSFDIEEMARKITHLRTTKTSRPSFVDGSSWTDSAHTLVERLKIS